MNRPLAEEIRIGAVGTANPLFSITQAEAGEILLRLYRHVLKPRSAEVLQKLFAHPSIQKRTLAVDNMAGLLAIREETPDDRIRRFTKWAVSLSCEAVRNGLSEAKLGTGDIGALIVNTCTGYLCPGISTYVSESLKLPASVPTYDLVGHGCGGAIPNLALAAALLPGLKQGVVVSVSVEICSATFQMGDDISLILSNALFGDGAAAAVLWKEPKGYRILETRSRLEPSFRDYVRFTHNNGALFNQLSPRLSETVRQTVPGLIRETLSNHGMTVEEVTHWAIHPGGDKILEELRIDLGLTRDRLWAAYGVLSDFGNMSSPTVLFELRRIMERETVPGDTCLLTAFGAGFSAYAALLRA